MCNTASKVTILKAQFYLFLPETVEIVIHPESGVYEVGNTVILTCVALGSQSNPYISWRRDGVKLDNDTTVRVYNEVIEVGGTEFALSNLELCDISMDDAGLYSCSASLPSGLNATSYFWVNVTNVPRKLEIHFTICLIVLENSYHQCVLYVDVWANLKYHCSCMNGYSEN